MQLTSSVWHSLTCINYTTYRSKFAETESPYYTNEGKVKDHFSIVKSSTGSSSSGLKESGSRHSNPFG